VTRVPLVPKGDKVLRDQKVTMETKVDKDLLVLEDRVETKENSACKAMVA